MALRRDKSCGRPHFSAAAFPHPLRAFSATGQARSFEGNPLELSYFLLSNLPVDDDVRQQLLEAKTVDARLRAECKLLQALGALCCRACGVSLARSADAVQVGGAGRGEAGAGQLRLQGTTAATLPHAPPLPSLDR